MSVQNPITHPQIRRELRRAKKVVESGNAMVALPVLDHVSKMVGEHLADEEREERQMARAAKPEGYRAQKQWAAWAKKQKSQDGFIGPVRRVVLGELRGPHRAAPGENEAALAALEGGFYRRKGESAYRKKPKRKKAAKKVAKKSGSATKRKTVRKSAAKRKAPTAKKRKPHKKGCKCAIHKAKRLKAKRAAAKKKGKKKPVAKKKTAKKTKKKAHAKKHSHAHYNHSHASHHRKTAKKTTRRKKTGGGRVSSVRGAKVPGHPSAAKGPCIHCGGPHSKQQHWSHLRGAKPRHNYETARPIMTRHEARVQLAMERLRKKGKRL